MKAKPNRVSKKVLFSGLLLSGCCLLLLDQRVTYPVQSSVRRLFHWPLRLGQGLPSLAAPAPPSPAGGIPGHLYQDQQARILHLENNIATLRAALAVERQHVAALSGLRQTFGLEDSDLVYASALVDVSPGQWIINRGSRDGVYEGLYALADEAAIGQIIQVGPHEATLLLATHPSSSIAAFLAPEVPYEAGEAIGKLDGLGNGMMRMRIRRSFDDIKAGTPVHIRQQPGILDIPFLIGRVSQVRIDQQDPVLYEVLVTPAARLDRVTGVSVVCPRYGRE
jgi:cell shape-determining protein MreC